MRTMPFASTVDAAAARAALASVLPRLTALIRSIRNPEAAAVGEWNAGDVAVHLAHVWETLPALSGGAIQSPIQAFDDLAGLTTSLVRGEADRDMSTIAARIEAAASTYLATPMADGGSRPWLIEGTSLPACAFACHILNESLVHGHDIAHAEGRRWRIDSAHAGMAIMGFLFPALSVVDPRAPVDQQHAAGVRACFDIAVRRAGRVYLVLDDGAVSIESPSRRQVDCHISAEATTLFLLIWSRTSQWPGALTGRLAIWGRRPWLGLRLPSMLRNP
jgi:hypothetical protein